MNHTERSKTKKRLNNAWREVIWSKVIRTEDNRLVNQVKRFSKSRKTNYRDGSTPIRVGTKPLNKAPYPSLREISTRQRSRTERRRQKLAGRTECDRMPDSVEVFVDEGLGPIYVGERWWQCNETADSEKGFLHSLVGVSICTCSSEEEKEEERTAESVQAIGQSRRAIWVLDFVSLKRDGITERSVAPREDWRRTLITSNGQVRIAPTVPPMLSILGGNENSYGSTVLISTRTVTGINLFPKGLPTTVIYILHWSSQWYSAFVRRTYSIVYSCILHRLKNNHDADATCRWNYTENGSNKGK